MAAAPSIDPISTGVQAASMIAGTLAGISDMNKRRNIEANLALLSQKEQMELAVQMSKLKNRNDQVSFLINAVLASRTAQADRDQRAQTVKWILIGSAGVVTLGILAWFLKK